MTILSVFLYALIVVVALLLIGLILIQPSKSGGMGAAFGGIGESVFGGKAGSHLTKSTVVLTGIFFLIALGLATLIGHGAKMGISSDNGVQKELMKSSMAKAKSAVPAAEAASAPKTSKAEK